jgi:hypothetical protein
MTRFKLEGSSKPFKFRFDMLTFFVRIAANDIEQEE